jgi:hypothetical protein
VFSSPLSSGSGFPDLFSSGGETAGRQFASRRQVLVVESGRASPQAARAIRISVMTDAIRNLAGALLREETVRVNLFSGAGRNPQTSRKPRQ